MIKVSIITVCFNSEKTIRRTIESVLKQTYENIEYIIVDGASKDGTIDIVREYEEEFGDRLVIISEPDEGMYYAMNKGIEHASGELIGTINADDWYEEDAVEMMVNAYSKSSNKYGVYYGMLRIFREDNWATVGIRSHKYIKEDMISHPACFVTRALYNDISKYDTRFRYVADYDFMLRMSEDKMVVFEPVLHIIANMQAGGASASGAAWKERIELQNEWGIISKKEYKKIKFKNKILDIIS